MKKENNNQKEINKENKINKLGKKSIIITIFSILLVTIIGTAAWLTWRSNDTALVLTIGDLNTAQVILKPYKINTEILPVNSYENELYTDVEAINSSSTSKKIKLFYRITNIDEELITEDFKYTITRSTDNGSTYEEYQSGNFSTAQNNQDFYILKENIPGNTTYKYKVYIWLDGSNGNQTEVQGKKFEGELRAEILNGSDVVVDLPDGLIPITYDVSGNNTIVKTIDSTNSSWYDYDEQLWANGVLVTESSRNTYLNTSGVTIPESDILAYYVYIPRYKYKIWTTEESSTGEEQEIEIIFENTSMTKSQGTQVGEYITHPAFTFGSNEVNGIWVGKFETTGTEETPTVKPDVTSLRNQNVSTQFQTALKFAGGTMADDGSVTFSGSSTYGLDSNIDSHMMKNSEWGAVAYLSHSKYGLNSEVYINNSSGCYTGRSGGNVGGSTPINGTYPDQTSIVEKNTYGFYTWDGYLLNYNTNTKSSTRDLTKVASTTGNITGVYDMSGGAYEYVMGNYNNTISSSGFTVMPSSKYYDLYTSTNRLTSCNGGVCFGHGISETSFWYEDSATFFVSLYSWLARSSAYDKGVISGTFHYSATQGTQQTWQGFRSVLVKAPYSDPILNGSDPVLDEGIIPITFDVSGDNTIIKTAGLYDEWYNYSNQEWANAILVTEESRDTYLGTSGVEVNQSDILAYLVWIPRYKYKIWTLSESSTGQEQEIEIVFESKDEISTGTQVGEYITHPAFWWDDDSDGVRDAGEELSGIWVGKFETTGSDSVPTVLPDVTSLRDQNVSAQFQTALIFAGGTLSGSEVTFTGSSVYGLTTDTDSHMMKNSEWGAVAYLSHSKYGVNREVYINNSSGYYTGRSGGNVGGSTPINGTYTDQTSTTQYNTYGFYTWDGYLLNYNTNTKSSTRDLTKVASTTGNITGVYDMSGGAYEYVMGNYNNTASNSGFSAFPVSKYYDKYTTTSSLTACNGGVCFGHALSETKSWYSDYASFVSSSHPWFGRGGYCHAGVGAGVFYFRSNYGNAYSGSAAHLVFGIGA